MTDEDVDENGDHKRTADEMDEERRLSMAREYLVRLDEARSWMAECLKDEQLSSTVEIEESLRNGVLLARMANFFAPKVVSERRIFDRDESRYASAGLQYRHTDNIVQWRRAMTRVGLPEVFMPETTDIYDKKNMPKAVFCLHALGRYLHRRNLAPPIRDASATAQFREEDVKAVADEMAAAGIQLPEFGKIDGMLADELTADQAKLHDAIKHINEQLLDVESLSLAELLTALQQPDAQLQRVLSNYIQHYAQQLAAAKQHKHTTKSGGAELDMYDLLLAQHEIQHVIDTVNEEQALHELDAQLTGSEADAATTLAALLHPGLNLTVHDCMAAQYLDELQAMRHKQSTPLTKHQIEAIVDQVNAVHAVNRALDSRQHGQLLAALQADVLQLQPLLDPAQSRRYLRRLRALRPDGASPLTAAQIRQVLTECQSPPSEDEQRADLLAECLEAVLADDKAGLLKALLGPSDRFSRVRDDCVDVYSRRIASAIANNPNLSVDEIQQLIDLTNDECDQALAVAGATLKVNEAVREPAPDAWRTLEEHAHTLGATVTPALKHTYVKQLHHAFNALPQDKHDVSAAGGVFVHEADSGIVVQVDRQSGQMKLSCAKPSQSSDTLLQHKAILKIINDCNGQFDKHYADSQQQVLKAQTQVRGFLAKKQVERQRQKRTRENRAAATIQQFYRNNASKKNYQELVSSDSPRVSVVRKFVQLLERTEMDYEEELEIETLKSEVASLVRSNRKLEENLNIMDVKIGLLVKNRLGVEDVLKHGEKISKSTVEEDGKNDRRRSSTTPNDIRRQNNQALRAYQDKVGAYQHLVYHLQTEPKHLASLLLLSGKASLTALLDSVLFPLFNHGTQRRDEYLLLHVLKQLLNDQLNQLQQLNKLVVADLLAPKIAVKFISHVGQNDALKLKVQSVIVKFLADKTTALNTQPLEIYKYAVGEPSEQLTVTEAAQHPEVAAVLEQTVTFLSGWGQQFLDVITSSQDNVPYLFAALVQSVHETLLAKYGADSRKEIDRVVNQVVFDTYVYPLIASPELDANKTMPPNDRKKLTAIARLLHFAALNRGYGQDNEAHLSALNGFIGKGHQQLSDWVRTVRKVNAPEAVYGYDPVAELTTVRKPTVYLLVADLLLLHKALLDVRNELDEQMNELISKAGDKQPSLKELTANAKEADDIAQTQITLSLKCTHPVPVDSQSASQSLFLRTKKQMVDLLLCQTGNSINAILEREPTNEERLKYVDLVCDRKQRAEENRFSYDPSTVSSLDELREITRDNLVKLEDHGLVSRKDDYQAVVNQIANDVRQAHQYRAGRHEELARVRDTLQALTRKQQYYSEQADYYRQYINGCLQNLAPKQNKRASIVVEDVKSKKDDDGGGKGWTSQSKAVKVPGDKLVKKNLLVKLDGQKATGKGVTVEFKSSSTPGCFALDAKLPDAKDTCSDELRFHDLLQSQYDGEETIRLFERAEFSVDELIYFLNKKFLM